MFNPSPRNTTHVMINARVTPAEKAALDALRELLDKPPRHHRYQVRGTIVAMSDVLRWGVEALRRELIADQAAADAAEYNAKRPARKPAAAAKPKGKGRADR
jgi:hypothetical protein